MWRSERRRWGSWLERADGCAAVAGAQAGEQAAGERHAEGGKDRDGDAAAGHLLQQQGTGEGEEEVCAPDAEDRVQSLPWEANATPSDDRK